MKRGRTVFRRVASRRVGFSAAVGVVPDPSLSPGECALPMALARELYRPLVVARLVRIVAGTAALDAGSEAAALVAERARVALAATRESSAAFDAAIAAIASERPLLVARRPARLRSQLRAFWPRLAPTQALGLAPLACDGLGLTGRGELVDVHVPLSESACDDASERLVWPAALTRATCGRPPMPTRQARLGLAYASLAPHEAKGALRLPPDLAKGIPPGAALEASARRERIASLTAFALSQGGTLRGFHASFDEVAQAYEAGELALHAAIVVREGGVSFLTSAGRCLVGEALRGIVGFETLDRELDEKALLAIVTAGRRRGGDAEAALVVERLERVGVEVATRAGLSLGADDLRPPRVKARIIERAHARIVQIEDDYHVGLLLTGEVYRKILDVWASAADEIGSALSTQFKTSAAGPLALFVRAGLVSWQEARHLASMRGLTAKASGEIFELGIASSLHDGLSPHECFLEAGHARVGALNRLFRGRLADDLLARLAACYADVLIEAGDCGSEGIELRPFEGGPRPAVSLQQHATLGRLLATDLPVAPAARVGDLPVAPAPRTGDLSVAPAARAGDVFDEAVCHALESSSGASVRVRSPLACLATKGVCAACYGRLPGQRRLAAAGEAVGVLAAQAIGEASRRLSQRAFHICCGAWQSSNQSTCTARAAGYVRLHEAQVHPRPGGTWVVLGHNASLTLVDEAGTELDYVPLPYGAHLGVVEGQKVEWRATLVEIDPHHEFILAEVAGVVRYDDLVAGLNLEERVDPVTGLSRLCVYEVPGHSLRPRACVVVGGAPSPGAPVEGLPPEVAYASLGAPVEGPPPEVAYALPNRAIVVARVGARVEVGDVLAKVERPSEPLEEVVGGLPRLVEILEARSPRDAALLCDIAGEVSFDQAPDGQRRLVVTPLGPGGARLLGEARAYPLGQRYSHVRRGERLLPGDELTSGPHDPHESLRIHGPAWIASHLVEAIMSLFAVSGEALDPRHVELVVGQMMRFRRVVDAGGTPLSPGKLVDRAALEDENDKARRGGDRPASAVPALVGVSRASRLRARRRGLTASREPPHNGSGHE